MKREDIYIEVTPETVGEYVAVLRKHGEKIGNVDVYADFRHLTCIPNGIWFVDIKSRNEPDTIFWTPEQLDKFLTELKEPSTTELYMKDSDGNFHKVQEVAGEFVPVRLDSGVITAVHKDDLFTIKPFKP